MKSINCIAAAGLLVLMLSGCGRKEVADASPTPPPSASAVSPGVKPAPMRAGAAQLAPVETFIVGGVQVPERLAARALQLTLRSNVEVAAYECRQQAAAAWRRDCVQGDQLSITALGNGNAYRWELRAVATNGAVDQTPLVIAFVVDLESGQQLATGTGAAAGASLPKDASELPLFVDPAASTASVATTHAVALGPAFAAVLPFGYRLSSYATDLTYNGRVKLYMALTTASVYGSPDCNRSWERIVVGKDGVRYCDATPRADELPQLYSRPLPRNHLETYKGSATAPEEKLFVAAFGDDAADVDPAESRLDIDANCRGAQRRGSSPVPLLAADLGGAARDQLDWCLVHGADGAWWWIGSFHAATANSGRIAAIYAAQSAAAGLTSSQDFVQRTVAIMKSAIVKLGAGP